ncbi:GNAT family N-acetyltransferase [Halobacillus sp. GSS1]|uniref:GNAT family N-acetyltransferase n=1 Tax=Halobacillus sp. GSS1 TaxID=2815919 RepID=UPI001A907987|nr:GNAT family N-acetyltransferase [Halobacillus sp. GSS1]MBN9654100.1 GNAT family N-acetyltransferase [Halobacillus sp. GSS1]
MNPSCEWVETERLSFRKYEDGDFPFLLSMVTDPETVSYIGNGKVKSDKGAVEFLQWIYRTYKTSQNHGLHVLVRKADGVKIGHAGLVPQSMAGKQELEIGYWISRQYWGHGYATEAAAALLKQGKRERDRLISMIQSGNTASQRVAEKIGMVKEKSVVLGGKDVWIYTV